ncbi:MAG: DUF302 domain-containing protein [Rhodococcus sp. (in: high G+C Gram-positive bacteria)]
MATYIATGSFEDTVAAVQAALGEAGMVVATLDHAANAASVGQQLRPTTLVIGGNSRAGTPVMAAEQTAGVDLPQKYLVWEDEAGTVRVGYNSAEYLAARAGIDVDDPALDALRTGSARIASAAAGTDTPSADGTLPEGERTLAAGDDYLLERQSDTSVAESIDRYLAAFAARDLQSVATIDHAANAATIDAELAPTRVTIVGNPAVGTALIQASQTFGIDLPIRYLAWQDDDGVHVGHPDIRVLAQRHGAAGVEDTLTMIEGATDMFDAIAAGESP